MRQRQTAGDTRRHGGVVLDDVTRAWMRELAERDGVGAAARAIGIGREPFARGVAGLPIMHGTEVIVGVARRTARP